MYSIGKYYRGNSDQKPEQWGSIADVQYAVRHWCEEWLGVDYSKLIFAAPGWQGANKKIIDLGYKSNGFGTQLVNGIFDKKYGINLTNPSYAYLNSTLHNNDGEEFSLFFDFIKRGSSTSRAILAGYNNNITYGYIGVYPGIRSRIRFSTSVDFTNTQVFNKRNQLVFVCDKNKNVKAYQNALLKQTISALNTKFDFNQIGALSGSYSIDDATIYNSFGFKTALNTQQVELLSNQPSKLYQPVSRPIYFDVSEGGAILASCTDGSLFSTQIDTSAKFSVAVQDSISLADSYINNANFLVSVTDSISFSDSLLSYVKILTQSLDGVTYSDQILSNAKLLSVLVDNATFQGNSSSIAKFLVVAEDNIRLSDNVINIVESVISAECLDGIIYLDTISNRINLNAEVIESIKLQDTLSTVFKAVAQASDGISLYDRPTFGSILSVLAEDGISLSDTSAKIIRLFVDASDSIKLTDNGQVKVKYNVTCSDTIQFADTVTNVMQLLATLFDGVEVSDRALEVSTLPSGKTRISFSVKTTSITFDIATPNMAFNTKAPSITFNVK